MKITSRTTAWMAAGLLLTMLAARPMAAVEESPGSFRVVSYINEFGPPSGLIEVSPGLFYSNGGTASQTVFSVTVKGATSAIARFPAGHYIQSPLVSASNGRFYSAIAHRDDPVVLFSVGDAKDSLQRYQPQDYDPMPVSGLPDGSLLAVSVTLSGDRIYSLIRCGLDGSSTNLHQFPAGETLPHTALYGTDSNYYGISVLPDGSAYVYRLTPKGELSKLTTFPPNSFRGSPAYVPLLQAKDGNLYGATTHGGEHGAGTIYKLAMNGQYTLLHAFPHSRFSFTPAALIEASDGNLYGITLGAQSQLFRITTSGQYTPLHTMNMYTDGECSCQLIQGSDGEIYGSAMLGGTTGVGTIFSWNGGLAKPAPVAARFLPESGAPGTEVLIWGANLLSATVTFNGIPAEHVSSGGASYIRATVPRDAATGPITVKTAGGGAQTQIRFSVAKRK